MIPAANNSVWIKRLIGVSLGPPTLGVYRLLRFAMTYEERRRLKRALRRCGPRLTIDAPFDIRGPEQIEIGGDVYIGPDVLIISGPGADVYIGDKVMFGPKVRIIPGNHKYDDPSKPMKDAGPGTQRPILIGSDVWIGAGATVLGGVHIGNGSVLGAGSVLTKNVGANEIWAGNPARKIKNRTDVTAGTGGTHQA